MTAEEARRNMIEATLNAGYMVCVDVDAVAEMLRAEEELQQYRAIGTVSEFRELKEKATAKKPNGIFFSREDGCRVGNCPSCGRYIKHREHKHCPRCGSLVDWSEGKE